MKLWIRLCETGELLLNAQAYPEHWNAGQGALEGGRLRWETNAPINLADELVDRLEETLALLQKETRFDSLRADLSALWTAEINPDKTSL